jgi:Sigma-70 region 2
VGRSLGHSQAVGSDRDLWNRLRSADQHALTDLFHRHSDAVYNFAFRRTSSWSAAEDIVQATFTALWRRATRVDIGKAGSITDAGFGTGTINFDR